MSALFLGHRIYKFKFIDDGYVSKAVCKVNTVGRHSITLLDCSYIFVTTQEQPISLGRFVAEPLRADRSTNIQACLCWEGFCDIQ